MRHLYSRRLWAAFLAVSICAPAGLADPTEPATKPATAATAKARKRQPPVKEKVELKPEVARKEAQPRIAHVRLDGPVLASPPEFSLFVGQTPGMTLREWIHRLAKARNDDRVQFVALEVDSLRLNWAQAQEFADAVKRLNDVKPVYAHITYGGPMQYLVGSAARELTMDPAGTLMITGLGAELMFFRGTLDWLGIRAQMIQVGRYKGAAEPFTRTEPSEEWKGQYDKLLDDLYDQLCRQMADQRHLTVPHVRQAIDEGPLDAPKAQEYRLVDRLVSKADWRDHVLKKAAPKKDQTAAWLANYEAKKPQQVNFTNPLAVFSMMFGGKQEEAVQDPTVALIHADGMIVSGKSGEGLLGGRYVGHKTMVECFQRVEGDDRIKAVIFRINSPGGSALASEMIYQAASRCARKKPVIASISALGASGGYYIALGGQKILADPAALTGSVGVVSGKLAIAGLLDKIGISTYGMTRGRNAGLWMSRSWDDREQEVVRRMAQRTYDTFVSRVRESRGRRIKDVESVVEGRIFTARQAEKNGLIDAVGGLREAVAAAQSAAKIDRSHILVLPRPKTILDVLSGQQAAALALPSAAGELGPARLLLSADPRKQAGLAYLLDLGRLLAEEPAVTALPYYLHVEP